MPFGHTQVDFRILRVDAQKHNRHPLAVEIIDHTSYRVEIATGSRKLWATLKPRDPVGVTLYGAVITPDGGSYVYSYQRDLADLYLISGLR